MWRASCENYAASSCARGLSLLFAPFVRSPHIGFNSDKIQEQMSGLTMVQVTGTSKVLSGLLGEVQKGLAGKLEGQESQEAWLHLLFHESLVGPVPSDNIKAREEHMFCEC